MTAYVKQFFGKQCRTCGHGPEVHCQTELIRFARGRSLPVGRAHCIVQDSALPGRGFCRCPQYVDAEGGHSG